MFTAIIESDIHAGNVYGLVNPQQVADRYKPFAGILFNWREQVIREIGHVDMVIELGETIDGPGYKSTIEHYTTDLEDQAEDAADLICMWDCDDFRLCYASKYHTGKESKAEHQVVDKIKLRHNKMADIKATQRIQIGDLKVCARHHVGNSRTGHGQFSQIGKVAANDYLRAAYRDYPGADLYFVAHTHKYAYVGDELYAAYNNPSMQWPMGEYGFNIDDPRYTMGLQKLTVYDDGSWAVKPYLLKVQLPEEVYARVG